MKKLIVFVLCAVMVLSMVPAMSLSVSAAVEGDWTTSRSPKDYPAEGEEDDSYTPAAGYQYTSEGFQTVSADFTNTEPYYRILTKEAQNLKEGLSMEFRIDQFSYKGPTGGADEWISIALWESDQVIPGDLSYDSGWLCLVRGTGDGNASVESFWTVENDEEGKGGSFGHQGNTSIKPEVDENGKEHYTLDVTWDGNAYDIQVCGVQVAGMSNISDKMKTLVESGDYYVAITFHSGVPNGVADLTILEFNGSTPAGDDSKPAEENVLVIGDMIDSATVPANQPALLFDATKTTFSKDPTAAGMDIAPQGDNSYHFTMNVTDAFMSWSIKRAITYEAADFPYLVIVLKDFYGDGGAFYYGAGETTAVTHDCQITWGPFVDENSFFMGAEEEYTFCVMNLGDVDNMEEDKKETWAGRINFIRMDFNGMSVGDEFDICFMGFFRSIEEAKAYTDARLQLEEATKSEETETEAESGKTEETDAETKKEDATTVDGTTASNETKAETGTSAAGGDDTGCASVVSGAVAVLVSAMAAAVALRKKH